MAVSNTKKYKDDIGRTIDGEDNLAKMILIEQAIDASFEIDEEVSRSYAFCDCIISIVEFARESHNEETLERVKSLFKEIINNGAYVRAQSYYALGLASFGRIEEAETLIAEAIENTTLIKDDFDKRDAILDIATTVADLSIIADKPEFIELALDLAVELTKGQKAYLYGYLSTVISDEKRSKTLMRKAVEIVDKIRDPITKSKVFLELSNLITNLDNNFEF